MRHQLLESVLANYYCPKGSFHLSSDIVVLIYQFYQNILGMKQHYYFESRVLTWHNKAWKSEPVLRVFYSTACIYKINLVCNLFCQAKRSHQHPLKHPLAHSTISPYTKCSHQYPLTHLINTCHYAFIQAIHISEPLYLLTYIQLSISEC